MFNLDTAVKQWLRSLRKNPALEDGYIEELHCHLLDEIEHLAGQGKPEKEAFETAVQNIGPVDHIGTEYYKTNTRNWLCLPPWQRERGFLGLLYNGYKVALRRLKRYKGFSAINILGLATGITCFIFISLFVKQELSYDNYHKDADRVYRVALEIKFESGTRSSAGNSYMLEGTLKENFPEVEAAGRVMIWKSRIIKYKNKINYDTRAQFASPGLLEVLSVPFIQGDPQTALSRPYTAVISQAMATEYFGGATPIGKTLFIDDKEYEITGLVENSPRHTHFKYGIIMSIASIKDNPYIGKWDLNHAASTYIKLAAGTDAEVFDRRIEFLAHEYVGEELKSLGGTFRYFLQPLRDIHLYSHLNEEFDPPGSMLNITILSIAGILILFIACLNFINLSTANYAARAVETGVRKVLGAQRRQLIVQFLGESLLVSFFALLAALVMFLVLLPFLNRTAGTHLTGAGLLQPDMMLILLGVVVVVGLLSGLYPAFFLSAFKPVSVLKGVVRTGLRGTVMRRGLVLVQFFISISLIIGSVAVYRQLEYMKEKDLGFDRDQKLVVRLPRGILQRKDHKVVKEEFSRFASIHGATVSSGIPGRWIYKWRLYPTGEASGNTQVIHCMGADESYIPMFDLKIIEGRGFSRDLKADQHDGGYILNEAAVKAFGWDSPAEAVGKTLFKERRPIVGVLKDFHFMGLQHPIEPLAMFMLRDDYRYLTMKVDVSDMNDIILHVQRVYRRFFPGTPLQYSFMDEDFSRQYESEERFGNIFRLFTVLGIFIACLGIFGLSTYSAEQRTKEIGIRKVLGAPSKDIFKLLTGEFVRWVILANILAWPVSYIAVRYWLRGFAYKVPIGIDIFILSGLAALLTALLGAGYRAVKAMYGNPVEALRYE